LVKKIALNENLTDEEREALLKMHEANMMNIDGLMGDEKKRQE